MYRGEVADEDELFRRIHLDLAAKGRERAAGMPPSGAETDVLLKFRRRIAGEDAVRGGLVFIRRNAWRPKVWAYGRARKVLIRWLPCRIRPDEPGLPIDL